MRRLSFLAIGFLWACSEKPATESSPRGTYVEVGGDQILVFDQQRFYSGPVPVPGENVSLEKYGLPYQQKKSKTLRCVILDPLVFAVSDQHAFTCNGVKFQFEGEDEKRVRRYLATCQSVRNGQCTTEIGGKLALQYRYYYSAETGVQRIQFVSDDPAIVGSVLEHSEGAYLLGAQRD